jgi:hypothetical protein
MSNEGRELPHHLKDIVDDGVVSLRCNAKGDWKWFNAKHRTKLRLRWGMQKLRASAEVGHVVSRQDVTPSRNLGKHGHRCAVVRISTSHKKGVENAVANTATWMIGLKTTVGTRQPLIHTNRSEISRVATATKIRLASPVRGLPHFELELSETRTVVVWLPHHNRV